MMAHFLLDVSSQRTDEQPLKRSFLDKVTCITNQHFSDSFQIVAHNFSNQDVCQLCGVVQVLIHFVLNDVLISDDRVTSLHVHGLDLLPTGVGLHHQQLHLLL